MTIGLAFHWEGTASYDDHTLCPRQRPGPGVDAWIDAGFPNVHAATPITLDQGADLMQSVQFANHLNYFWVPPNGQLKQAARASAGQFTFTDQNVPGGMNLLPAQVL